MNYVFEKVGQPAIEYVAAKDAVHSASYQLNAINATMSAREFNKRAAEKGILIQKTRPSHRGDKHFWTISDAFSEYGRNDTNPQNPKETQPNWYDSKFGELFNLITA